MIAVNRSPAYAEGKWKTTSAGRPEAPLPWAGRRAGEEDEEEEEEEEEEERGRKRPTPCSLAPSLAGLSLGTPPRGAAGAHWNGGRRLPDVQKISSPETGGRPATTAGSRKSRRQDLRVARGVLQPQQPQLCQPRRLRDEAGGTPNHPCQGSNWPWSRLSARWRVNKALDML
ncbi:unnamed protein product [Prorocentrum cordatum]|uniref:Uncharacterized protein n=1 Tax=Prorocentrum cordatum TaxID=2364126 RepID=A0ABN9XC64_9DINO|nr:unnamed protein product [Polarella glacialis]